MQKETFDAANALQTSIGKLNGFSNRINTPGTKALVVLVGGDGRTTTIPPDELKEGLGDDYDTINNDAFNSIKDKLHAQLTSKQTEFDGLQDTADTSDNTEPPPPEEQPQQQPQQEKINAVDPEENPA